MNADNRVEITQIGNKLRSVNTARDNVRFCVIPQGVTDLPEKYLSRLESTTFTSKSFNVFDDC